MMVDNNNVVREFRNYNCISTDKDGNDEKTEEIRVTCWNTDQEWKSEDSVKKSFRNNSRKLISLKRI